MEKVWFQMSVEYDYSWNKLKFSFYVRSTSPLYYFFRTFCLIYMIYHNQLWTETNG